jgi:hypothetical protein
MFGWRWIWKRYAIRLPSMSGLIPVVLVPIDRAGTTRLDATTRKLRRRRLWRMAIILSSNTPPQVTWSNKKLLGSSQTLTMGQTKALVPKTNVTSSIKINLLVRLRCTRTTFVASYMIYRWIVSNKDSERITAVYLEGLECTYREDGKRYLPNQVSECYLYNRPHSSRMNLFHTTKINMYIHEVLRRLKSDVCYSPRKINDRLWDDNGIQGSMVNDKLTRV